MISKLRSRPPIASADDFIAGADQQTAAVEPPGQAPPAPLPWEDSQVREDSYVSRPSCPTTRH